MTASAHALVNRAVAEEDRDVDLHLSRLAELAAAWGDRVVPTPDLSQIGRGNPTGDPELMGEIDRYKEMREQERKERDKDKNMAKSKTKAKTPAKTKAPASTNGHSTAAAASAAVEEAVDPYNRPTDRNGMPLCMDGCGQAVSKLTTRFIVGHDSRLKSVIIKVGKGSEAFDAIPEIGQAYAADYAREHDIKPWPPKATVGAKANK